MMLCLGTVQFGLDYGIQGSKRQPYNKIDEIIDYALLNGVNHFDTASAYGDAESIIGHYVKSNKLKKDNVKVVSKLTAGVFDGREERTWPDVALSQAKESLDALKLDKLEGYLFHNASKIYNEIAVKAIYEVKNRGIADRVGVSVYTPQEALKALEYKEIEIIQIPYNLFDQRLDKTDFFEIAKAKNISVYARSILLQGLLTMRYGYLPQHMLFAQKYLKKLHEICERHGVSPLEAAIGYVSSHEGIDYAVFGVDSIIQLKEFLKLKDYVLPDDIVEEVRYSFVDVEERLVNPTLW